MYTFLCVCVRGLWDKKTIRMHHYPLLLHRLVYTSRVALNNRYIAVESGDLELGIEDGKTKKKKICDDDTWKSGFPVFRNNVRPLTLRRATSYDIQIPIDAQSVVTGIAADDPNRKIFFVFNCPWKPKIKFQKISRQVRINK